MGNHHTTTALQRKAYGAPFLMPNIHLLIIFWNVSAAGAASGAAGAARCLSSPCTRASPRAFLQPRALGEAAEAGARDASTARTLVLARASPSASCHLQLHLDGSPRRAWVLAEHFGELCSLLIAGASGRCRSAYCVSQEGSDAVENLCRTVKQARHQMHCASADAFLEKNLLGRSSSTATVTLAADPTPRGLQPPPHRHVAELAQKALLRAAGWSTSGARPRGAGHHVTSCAARTRRLGARWRQNEATPLPPTQTDDDVLFFWSHYDLQTRHGWRWAC